MDANNSIRAKRLKKFAFMLIFIAVSSSLFAALYVPSDIHMKPAVMLSSAISQEQEAYYMTSLFLAFLGITTYFAAKK